MHKVPASLLWTSNKNTKKPAGGATRISFKSIAKQVQHSRLHMFYKLFATTHTFMMYVHMHVFPSEITIDCWKLFSSNLVPNKISYMPWSGHEEPETKQLKIEIKTQSWEEWKL